MGSLTAVKMAAWRASYLVVTRADMTALQMVAWRASLLAACWVAEMVTHSAAYSVA